jgi:Tfp pilus assembly protein PilF
VIPQPVELIRELSELLNQDPQFVSAYLLKANVYKLSHAPDNTEALCYNKMLEAVPNRSKGHAFVWYRSAYYYEKKLLDMETALAHYQEAVRLNPGCYQALFKLGYYAASDKRFDEAEALLNRAIKEIFRGRSTDPNENGEYRNWLSLYLKDSQYVYKAYMLLAKIALNRNHEFAIKSSVGRACMAATRFDETTLLRHIADMGELQYLDFLNYHQLSTPVWAMWQLLRPWSEDIVRDYYVRDIVRQKLQRWTKKGQ